jgi:hypothetical protein
MNLDFLKQKKIITERLIINANELDDIKQIILKKSHEQLDKHKHKQGFIIEVKELKRIGDLFVNKDEFNGKYNVDVILLVDILELESGDLIYNNTIEMINKAGIFASNWNGKIKIFIPSDELINTNFNEKYKKNDKINIEIIDYRSTIYDDEIIINGRIHYYKMPSRRKLCRKISQPIYFSSKNYKSKNYKSSSLFLVNINNNQKKKIDNNLNYISIIDKPTILNKSEKNIDFGYPWGYKLDYYNNIDINKLDQFYKNLLYPYNLVSKKLGLSINQLEIMEILKVFKFLINFKNKTLNIYIKIFNTRETKSNSSKLNDEKNNLLQINNNEYENIIKKITNNKLKLSIKKESPELAIFVSNTYNDHLELLLYLLKYKPNKCIIYCDINNNNFLVQWLYIITMLYKNVWLYKPQISNQLLGMNYLILNKCNIDKIDKSIIKNLFTSIKQLHSINKNNLYIQNFITHSFTNKNDYYLKLPNDFIEQIRNFNEYLYKIIMEKYEEIKTISSMYSKTSQEIKEYEKQQEKISKIWIDKNKII